MTARPTALLALLLAACTPKADAPPALAASTDALDFGSVGLGESSVQTVTLTNTGGGEVTLLSVSLIEGQASIYDVNRDPVDSLGAGESADVTVTFSPGDERTYDGRVQVRSDDPANDSLYVDLTGVGAPSTVDGDGDGTSPATGDCDDANPDIHPGAAEVCDGRDDDCDGAIPADEADADYDGFLVCEGDCDDTAATIYPGAPEICDDADSDCDGASNDRVDQDGDGVSVCDGDCDDAEPAVYAGHAEVCDGLDNDCSGTPDDIDADHDGHSPCGTAGDCDDTDPTAFPVVVAAGATGKADGTEEHPYASVADALDHLDAVCRTIQLQPGAYEIGLTWSTGRLTIGGAGTDPGAILVTAPARERAFDVTAGADLTLGMMTIHGTTTAGDGGAARVVGGTLTAEGVVFDTDTCTGDGGALAAASSTVTLDHCTFTGNAAEDDGGALSVLSSTLTDTGSRYEANFAVRGGALLIETSSAHLADLVVTLNTATDEGGGIELLGGSATTLERSWITLNSAATIGGGLSLVDFGDRESVIRNNAIVDNTATDVGGGVALSGSTASVLLVNNTILSNEGGSGGGGIDIDVGASPDLYVWANIVGWSGGRAGIHSAGGGASVAYNLLYSTTSGTDLDLGAGEDGGENETANPQFRAFSNDGDPTDDTLTLAAGSPALDSGPATGAGPSWYLDWSDPDGSRNDRGATGGPGASP